MYKCSLILRVPQTLVINDHPEKGFTDDDIRVAARWFTSQEDDCATETMYRAGQLAKFLRGYLEKEPMELALIDDISERMQQNFDLKTQMNGVDLVEYSMLAVPKWGGALSITELNYYFLAPLSKDVPDVGMIYFDVDRKKNVTYACWDKTKEGEGCVPEKVMTADEFMTYAWKEFCEKKGKSINHWTQGMSDYYNEREISTLQTRLRDIDSVARLMTMDEAIQVVDANYESFWGLVNIYKGKREGKTQDELLNKFD